MDPKSRPTKAAVAGPQKEGKSKTLGAPGGKSEKGGSQVGSAGSKTASNSSGATSAVRPSASTRFVSSTTDLGASISADDDQTLKGSTAFEQVPPDSPSITSSPSPLTPGDSSSSSGGNCKVCVRFRPPNAVEKESGGCWVVESPDEKTIKVKDPQVFQAQSFSFDRVFMPEATQQSVYDVVGRPLVTDVLNGYNCSLMAYGQTGSGKTHTMMGEDGELKGIIPRIIEDVFNCMESAPQTIEFTIRVSYVEIYLERICDLLNPENADLKVREDVVRGLYLEGVEELYVGSREEIQELMERGSANRSVASTRMNADSSRSHSVFIITADQNDSSIGVKKCGRMYLVDLAGSETVSKTNASGQTLQEAKMINKSLSALGNVIKALTERQAHIPYRDSKLTRLLQDALGGNSKTSLIIACSGSSYNVTETLSTLRFGTRAKSIRNRPRVNQERSLEEYKRLLDAAAAKEKDLEHIIRRLEDQVQDLLKNMSSPKAGGAGSGKIKDLGKEGGGAKEEEGAGVADLIAAELITIFNVLQPMMIEVRDELMIGVEDLRVTEIDSLLMLLNDAVATRTAPILASGSLRMFQILKEMLDEKTRAIGQAASAAEAMQSAFGDKNAADLAERKALLSERERIVSDMRQALIAKDTAIASFQAQVEELRTASEAAGNHLLEATQRLEDESERTQLAEEKIKELEAALVTKDYEFKEQTLVLEQLRTTLDTIMTTVPTASIVTSVVSSPKAAVRGQQLKDMQEDTTDGDAGATGQNGSGGSQMTQKDRDLENDLRDLMARYLDMRVKYEEEKAAVEQLQEVLNEAANDRGEDGQSKDSKIAQTVVELRRALDRKSSELQEKGVLIQSLSQNKTTMEAQLSNRDSHIKHLEAMVKDLQCRIRDSLASRQGRGAVASSEATRPTTAETTSVVDPIPVSLSPPLIIPSAVRPRHHHHLSTGSDDDDESVDGNNSPTAVSVLPPPTPADDGSSLLRSRQSSVSSAASPSVPSKSSPSLWPLPSPTGGVEAGIDWMAQLLGGAKAAQPTTQEATGAGKVKAVPFQGRGSVINLKKVIRGRGTSKVEETNP